MNENIEFKELYTENIYKEIVAFLNSGSGTIYIGYNDNGELIGLENVKETEEKISNGIRGKIVPDCSVFVSINNATLDNKDYIIINVSKGVNIYSLKGLKIYRSFSFLNAVEELSNKTTKESLYWLEANSMEQSPITI